MTEISNNQPGAVSISLESAEISVAPGSSVIVPVILTNHGLEAGGFQIIVEGIPPSWASTSSPVTHLEAGEEKQITLILQPPTTTETGPGIFPFTIRIVNQQDPNQTDRVEANLTLAAYTVEGRIGVMLESTQFSVAPGSSTTVQMSLHNQGLVEDQFRFTVDGIPIAWITTASPVASLTAGEQRRVTFTIIPPPGSATPAGRYPFKIQVSSEQVPDQMAEIECTLTVGAVSGFGVAMDPDEIRDGQTGKVVVTNLGNTQTPFTVSWMTEEDTLAFDPAEPQQVVIPGGESAGVEFSSKPSRRPFIGSDITYPFTANVKSSDGDEQKLEGKLIGAALIPFWIVPVLLFLCLAVICVSFFVFVWQSQSDFAQATQTSVSLTETALAEAGILPTEIPETGEPGEPTQIPTDGPLPSEVPTGTPLPTETFIPTETPVPTETFVPTDTPIVIPDVGRIAFQSNREGDPELYLLDTATGAIGRLTTSLGVDTQPSYSDDGSRLAFVSDRTGNNEIFVANADGSNPVNITNHPGVDQTPNWSPDGQWITFTTNRDGNLEIYIMRPDGSELQNLTNNSADDQKSSWFGGVIAFETNRDGNQEIYLMNIDGSNQGNITNNPANDNSPAGAPNGSRIAFTSDRDGNLEIYLMNIDGTNQVNLTNNPNADQWASWSNDNNWITFFTDRDGNQEIYIIRDDATQIFNVTNNPAPDIVPEFQ